MAKDELFNLKIEKIRNIFSKHIATVKKYDDLTVVEWKNSNGEYVYSMTLIYKDRTVYISGDLGNAVFNLTWNADIGSFKNKSVVYLIEKLSAINIHDDLYVFDEETAKTYLMEEFLIDNQIDFPEEFYNLSIKEADTYLSEHRQSIEYCHTDDYVELFCKLWKNAYECEGDQNKWVESVNALVDDLIEYDEALDLYDIGKEYSPRVLFYAVALQMIDEHITEKYNDKEGNKV